MLDAFLSIFAELKGRYCEGAYSFKGAYVYLTIINFFSLSLILTALFTYLDVFHREWVRGKVKAHGMFWCVKGPIMVNFYFAEILLSILTTAGVIKGSNTGSIEWPADAVKNGIKVIIICAVMMIDSFMIFRFFGPSDNIANAGKAGQTQKMSAWKAFVDGYLAYIPEFLRTFFCCGVDSYRLAKKRRELKKRNKNGDISPNENSDPTNLLLEKNNVGSTAGEGYRMNQLQSAPSAAPEHHDQYDSYHTAQQQPIYQQQEGYPPHGEAYPPPSNRPY